MSATVAFAVGERPPATVAAGVELPGLLEVARGGRAGVLEAGTAGRAGPLP